MADSVGRVEVLLFDGCPNAEALLARLPELLFRAGVVDPPALRRVATVEEAVRERFLGSPSVRVDGRDVEPGAEDRTDYGMKCRLYRTIDGMRGQPPDAWLLAALGFPSAATSSS